LAHSDYCTQPTANIDILAASTGPWLWLKPRRWSLIDLRDRSWLCAHGA
jgi:hypothetical protein